MKNRRFFLTAVVVLTLFTSCSDWLTLEPEDGVTREEFWQTKEQLHSAVIGCYCSLQDGPVNYMFVWGELRGDMLESGANVNSSFQAFLDGEISASNNLVNWADMYTTINNCNTVAHFAPAVQDIDKTLSDAQLNAYLAEALTIRAMMYFSLVRTFRDVPLVLNASITDNQDYSIPKTSGDVILDTIVKDLYWAQRYAPESYSTTASNKSRITRWAVKTLLADILLWQEKYEECNDLCNEIIASGRFSMIPVEKQIVEIGDVGMVYDSVTVASESDADNVFYQSYVKGSSIESIFEVPFSSKKNNPFYNWFGPTVNQLKPKLDIVEDGIFPPVQYASSSDAVDIRATGFSYRLGLVWKYVGTGRSSSARTSTEYTSPWIMYKYSDVLLMKAEALNQIGLKNEEHVQLLDTTVSYVVLDSLHTDTIVRVDTIDYYPIRNQYLNQAVNCLNIVRNARNAVMTDMYKFGQYIEGKQLEKAILEERAREFSYEGKRWYDVLRYAKRNNYEGDNLQYLISLAIRSASPQKQQSLMAKYRDPKHNSHYLPIFNDELETNKELVQNEFYAQ